MKWQQGGFTLRNFLTILILTASAYFGASVAAAYVQGSDLAMLNGLSRGEWTVEFRDGRPARKICVKTGDEFIQLRHSQSGCNRFVIDDSPTRVTVQYTCRGDGYARTDIRRESSRLVQIESQGIAEGVPFQFAAEARRTGNCSAAS